MMKSIAEFWRVAAAAGMIAAVATAAGCDWDDDGESDHVPAPGQGALIVDNQTATDIDVFVDGRQQGKVDDFDEGIWDLAPGVYRVVLDEHNGDRAFAADVDVLEGRNTIMDVGLRSGVFGSYDVVLTID